MEDNDHDFSDFEEEHIIDLDSLPGDGLVVASHLLPEQLPLIPVRPRPAFPGLLIPMALNDPLQVATFRFAMKESDQTIGLVLVRDMDAPDIPENLHNVGVVGKVVKVISDDERMTGVFYVRNSDGQKILEDNQIESITQGIWVRTVEV